MQNLVGQTTTVPNTTGYAWSGFYPPLQVPGVCPSCNYCPHCGRSNHSIPPYSQPQITYTGNVKSIQ